MESKANVNQPTRACSGRTALHHAVEHGLFSLAEFFVSAGACTHPILQRCVKENCHCHKSDHDPDALEIVSPYAMAPESDRALRKWLRSVEMPYVYSCEKCEMKIDLNAKSVCDEQAARIKAKVAAAEEARCCNPECPLNAMRKDGDPPLKLKRCRRCLQASYCRCVGRFFEIELG